MYYGDSVRHLLLIPITKYRFIRAGTLYKVLLTSVSRKHTNYMYYGDSVRHLLLTPITKYKYDVPVTFDKCLTKTH